MPRIVMSPFRAALVAALTFGWMQIVLVLASFTLLPVVNLLVRGAVYAVCETASLCTAALVFLSLLGDAVIVLPPDPRKGPR